MSRTELLEQAEDLVHSLQKIADSCRNSLHSLKEIIYSLDDEKIRLSPLKNISGICFLRVLEYNSDTGEIATRDFRTSQFSGEINRDFLNCANEYFSESEVFRFIHWCSNSEEDYDFLVVVVETSDQQLIRSFRSSGRVLYSTGKTCIALEQEYKKY